MTIRDHVPEKDGIIAGLLVTRDGGRPRQEPGPSNCRNCLPRLVPSIPFARTSA